MNDRNFLLSSLFFCFCITRLSVVPFPLFFWSLKTLIEFAERANSANPLHYSQKTWICNISANKDSVFGSSCRAFGFILALNVLGLLPWVVPVKHMGIQHCKSGPERKAGATSWWIAWTELFSCPKLFKRNLKFNPRYVLSQYRRVNFTLRECILAHIVVLL